MVQKRVNLVLFATDNGWATGHGGRMPLRGNAPKVIALYNRSRIFLQWSRFFLFFFWSRCFWSREGSTLAGATLGDINSPAPLVENFYELSLPQRSVGGKERTEMGLMSKSDQEGCRPCLRIKNATIEKQNKTTTAKRPQNKIKKKDFTRHISKKEKRCANGPQTEKIFHFTNHKGLTTVK